MKSNNASNGRQDRTSKTKKNDSTTAAKQTDNSQKSSDQILDPDLKEKVLQLMDIAQCTQDNAFFALHDTDNDVNTAAMLLLERNNDMQDGWKEQKAKNKKKQQPAASPAATESDVTVSTEGDGDSFKDSNNRERSYPRNAPPRMQRSRGSRPEGRYGGQSGGRYNGGERGRPRGRGGSSRGGGFSRSNEGGFGRNRGTDNHNTEEQADLGSAPQIGTWTSEADANPKTDSWGERWSEDDNQWQGDLKSTHVFESTAKTDTFPTPTEFDPSAVAALPTEVSQSSFQSASNMNGSTQQSSTATSLSIDSLFPKQQVETMAPPTISMYDSQRASDSIKSAIGMPTHQQMVDEAAKNKALGHGQQSGTAQAASSNIAGSQSSHSVPPLMGASQPQRQNKQQRSKVPPPSTKIPTAPVEMPVHTQSNTMMNLGVQFGTMDFGDSSSKLESSNNSGYTPVSIPSTVQQHMNNQQSLQGSMFTSGAVSHGSQQSAGGPEPIPYPSSNTQQSSNQSMPAQQNRAALQHPSGAGSSLYHNSSNMKDNQSSHSGYSNSGNVGSQYKPSQSSHSVNNSQSNLSGQSPDTHPVSQSFQNSQTSGSAGYYELAQNLPDKRGSYQTSSQSNVVQSSQSVSSQATNQYTNSLYSSGGDQLNVNSSYGQVRTKYNSSVSPATSMPTSSPASITSHVAPIVSSQSHPMPANINRSATNKQGPPNLPPPGVAVTGATPLVPVGPNYIMGASSVPYYNQGYYTTSMEEMHKYQHQAMANNPAYYDVNINQFMPASTSFSGTAAGGAGDGKMTRIDAQSPTVQGSQSAANQSQQSAPTNTQSHQQFVSLPPGYANFYYPQTVMPPGYANVAYQVQSVTQGMSLTGSNTAVYSNQQKASSGSSAAYYPGSSGYEDNLQSTHSTDYNKTPYGANKQQTNSLSGTGSSSADAASSMYKSVNNSGSNPAVAANMYGGGQPTASAYMSPAQAHVLSNQHLMQSQMPPVAQDSSVGVRGTQAVTMPKAHSKYYSSGSWAN